MNDYQYKFETEMSKGIFEAKYRFPFEETNEQPVERVINVVKKYFPEIEEEMREAIYKKWIGPSGGLWRSALNPSKKVSSINCTTLDQPGDNLESISEGWYWWAKFAAYGQGEGVDLSKLRPNGAIVHNSSNISTGPISFMRTFDGILSEIAQEGRRGASLISLNISHPDIPDFITVKDEEGVLETANISIHITDEFMSAVKENKKWKFSYENKYGKTEKETDAKKLFKFIAEHTWKSGDPGVQFIDIAKKYSNSDYLGYPIISTNACSEQWLDAHNVCLLSSVNLAKYSEYGPDKYPRIVQLVVYLLEAFRQYELEENRSPSPLQIEKLKKLPRIGVGVTGLADYFIDKKIRYASKESIPEVRYLFRVLALESYKASYEIAKKEGESFEYYDKGKYKKSPFVKRLLDEGWIEDYHLDYQAHVCKTTVAPNGSLTEIVEAGGGGVEPIFAPYFMRRERATTGDWKEWPVINHAVRHYLQKNDMEITKENADLIAKEDWFITAHDVKSEDKINMMAEIQKYIDSAVSITYNLPKESTPKDIEEIYFKAWEKEIKAVAVYRDGSKTGIFSTEEKNKSNEVKLKERPKELPCDIYEMSVDKKRVVALVGLLDGEPYEAFLTDDPDGVISVKHAKEGVIEKIKSGWYNLKIFGKRSSYTLEITSEFDSEWMALGRMASLSLRFGIPVPEVVDQLNKTPQFGTFSKGMARVLKKYIKNDEKVLGKVCPECGSELIYKEGCHNCPICGWSKC